MKYELNFLIFFFYVCVCVCVWIRIVSAVGILARVVVPVGIRERGHQRHIHRRQGQLPGAKRRLLPLPRQVSVHLAADAGVITPPPSLHRLRQ